MFHYMVLRDEHRFIPVGARALTLPETIKALMQLGLSSDEAITMVETRGNFFAQVGSEIEHFYVYSVVRHAQRGWSIAYPYNLRG